METQVASSDSLEKQGSVRKSMIYMSSAGSSRVTRFSKWTYTQLRVLIVSGGNRAFRDYMDQFDLMDYPLQKRYSTMAAHYYRDLLKNKIKGNN